MDDAEGAGVLDTRQSTATSFWVRWLISGMLGWAIGAPAVFMALQLIAFPLQLGAFPVFGLILAALVAAVIIVPQWLAVRPFLRAIRWWFLAHIVGLPLALGAAGTLMMLMRPLWPFSVQNAFVAGLLASVLAVVTQWLILRRQMVWWLLVDTAGLIPTAAVAVMVGGPVIFWTEWAIMQSDMSQEEELFSLALVLCVIGAIAGAAGNAISGLLAVALGRRLRLAFARSRLANRS